MIIDFIFSNIKNVFIFAGFLSVLIVVHEWGHFITAKKLGIDVERFSLGFGPKLYSKVHNGTEFLLCLIPLGGYVKMAGDEKSECKGDPGEFYSKSPGKRALVIINGPITNFILAYVCLVLVFMLGFPDLSNKVGKLLDGYPAQVAGMQIGDIVTSINDEKIQNWSDLQKAVSTSEGLQIEVEF